MVEESPYSAFASEIPHSTHQETPVHKRKVPGTGRELE